MASEAAARRAIARICSVVGLRDSSGRGRLDGLAQGAVLVAQGLNLEQAGENQPHLLEGERLHEIVVRAAADRLDCIRDGRIRRHQDHTRLGMAAAELTQQREPIHACHADVREDHVECAAVHGRQRFHRVSGELGVVAELADISRQVGPDAGVVVDDEHTAHGRLEIGRASCRERV